VLLNSQLKTKAEDIPAFIKVLTMEEAQQDAKLQTYFGKTLMLKIITLQL
jgi:hypothetical protein